MLKERRMLEAHIYKKNGYTQQEIAEKLGVTDRTVRNYLKSDPCQRKKGNIPVN